MLYNASDSLQNVQKVAYDSWLNLFETQPTFVVLNYLSLLYTDLFSKVNLRSRTYIVVSLFL